MSSKASTDAPALDFRLERASPFSFACGACGRCCANKVIMVGPHEVLGMARHLGIGTTEFLAKHTANGGTTLRFEADGRCAFVTEAGCAVHPRRPLVCRLYPLGRSLDWEGVEKFAAFPKEPGCRAEWGTGGTIADFLEAQGVAPYLEWSRRYGEIYRRMLGVLDRLDIQGKIEEGEAGAGPGRREPESGTGSETGSAGDRAPLSSWQDIDASLAAFCAAKGIEAPRGVEEAIGLHLAAMGEWLDGLEARVAAEGPDGS